MWCLGEGIGWWSWFGGIWMVLVGGGLITLITWGTMYLSRKNRTISDDSALNIAKGRYARGEITKEEYEQFRKDL